MTQPKNLMQQNSRIFPLIESLPGNGVFTSSTVCTKGSLMKTRSRWIVVLLLTIAAALVVAPASAQQQPHPERNAYFGETHIHTSWSFDAYIYGNTKAGPEDAYKFALGQTITHPAGYPIKITRPLDFMAVTDHAEYVGIIPQANDPNSRLASCP